jgi:CheY-like chemotaxis protein
MDSPEEVVIVLAEDDPGHARLIEKHLHSVIVNKIVRFADGKQALDYLRREERPAQQHLLLLDLNMPVMDGFQVLGHLKRDEQTKRIPVIVLTTSDGSEEIQRCFDLGCNAYVVKSADYEEFTEAMHRLGLFLTVTRMPQGGEISLTVPSAPSRIGLIVSKPIGWQHPKTCLTSRIPVSGNDGEDGPAQALAGAEPRFALAAG